MWLYPLKSLLALAGWVFVLATAETRVILSGLGTLVLGVLFSFLWSWTSARRAAVTEATPRKPEGAAAAVTR